MASVGDMIGGYRLVKELACGSFGCVYRGEHIIFPDDTVAMKVLHANLGSQKHRDDFIQEARLLKKFNHPHILPILGAGIHDGSLYLVLEYAPNGSLKDRLKRAQGKPLPVDEAVSILLQIGDALHYAHEEFAREQGIAKGIVHRDLKPDNILFNARDDVLVADFGIAVALEGTEHVDITGTAAYMAPEQFDGDVSKKSDQYALGCIAYELFTGRRTFLVPGNLTPIAYWVAWRDKHLNEQPTPPTQHNPHLPAHIEQAILKAMAKKREDRHADVAAFMEALRQASKTGNVDFPMFGYDLAHTRYNPHEHILSPTNVSRLVPLWSAPTGGPIWSSPAVANGVVYVGSGDSKLYAFEAGTGKPLWSAATGNLISASPAVANGVVYVGSGDTKLYAFEAPTGKPLWSAPTSSVIYSSPAVANGMVYVGSFDKKLYAFEAGTGKPLWSAATGNFIDSSPAVANGVVYVGSRDSKLYAFHVP